MKICIITGCAKGLGAHMAEIFTEKGYQVVGIDILEPDFTKINYYFIKADLAKLQDIIEAFSEIKMRHGKAHILINNAAISVFQKPISEISESDYDKLSDINQKGAFFCAQEFIKLNKSEDYGRIINIASTRYHQNEADWELYGMSKGAIVSLTNTLCVSLRGTPVTVNAISPGYIYTGNYGLQDEREKEIHPSNRIGRPSDITNACLFFADEDNDFINGANLIIDGGMTKRMIY